jgi:hypothetical protein
MELKSLVNKPVLVIYEDSGEICRAKGILRDANPDLISVETNNNFLIISTKQILKVKIPKGVRDEK